MSESILLLFGSQGSGKGTQAVKLAEHFGYPVVIAGDLTRAEAKHDTERGRQVKQIIERGDMLPAPLMTELLMDEVKKYDATKGIVFDGYPRNLEQQQLFDGIVSTLQRADDVVAIVIHISDEEAYRRLEKRVQCSRCYAVFKDSGMVDCPQCGGTIEARADDTDRESVAKRLRLYHELTVAAIDVYRERGKLVEVNGEQAIDKVFQDILNALQHHKK